MSGRVPKSQYARLKSATELYHEFTGHEAKSLTEYPHPQGGTGCAFGALDFIDFRYKGQTYRLMPHGHKPKIAASFDGKQLYICTPFPLPPDIRALGVDIGKVYGIAYTARRDGIVERYYHDFRPQSAPTLKRRGEYLIFEGGNYRFKDTGINDE